MALEKTTELYEVLLRFEGGQLKGAHRIEIERIIEDGQQISATAKGAEPVQAADLDGLISTQNADLLLQVQELQAEIAALEADSSGI